MTEDGPGGPARLPPPCLERFARADAARTNDGVGLGLAIVRTERRDYLAGAGRSWFTLCGS